MNLKGQAGLVIDDHPHMRHLWRTILRLLEVEKLWEADGPAEAMERLLYGDVTFTIVDYQLPEMDGADLVRLIRRAPDSPARLMPIIMCTAFSSPSIVKRCIDAGADEVLCKPVSAQQAFEKIQAALFHRRPMVETEAYIGPDRRRRQVETPLKRRAEDLTSYKEIMDAIAAADGDYAKLTRLYNRLADFKAS